MIVLSPMRLLPGGSRLRTAVARDPFASLAPYRIASLKAGGAWRALALCLTGAAALALGAPSAQALPSYARQTGQECAACHNGFPELTPYGRLFKLNAYTFKGGYRHVPIVEDGKVVGVASRQRLRGHRAGTLGRGNRLLGPNLGS